MGFIALCYILINSDLAIKYGFFIYRLYFYKNLRNQYQLTKGLCLSVSSMKI